MNDMLTVKGLSKTLGKVKAVNDVSFTVRNREFLAIQGHSGAGKTTLLSLLAGLESADDGEIIVGKENITSMDEERLALFRRENMGIVFQFFNLIPTLNAAENIALPLFPMKMGKKEMLRRAKDAAEQVGLEKRTSHYPNELSGGEQQRVAIARALITNPKVVLADEPTGNLDSTTGKKIIELLRKLNKDRHLTMVIVTHDNAIANRADRIIRMKDGRVKHE